VLRRTVRHSLAGTGAHVEAHAVFEGLDWKLAGTRPPGAPHSVHQLLNHIAFWQDWAARWLDGEDPAIPRRAAGSWPGTVAPASAAEWRSAVRRLRQGASALARRTRRVDLLDMRGSKSPLQMLHTIGSHNSYHAGQAALVRQMLGAWPPPQGPLTW